MDQVKVYYTGDLIVKVLVTGANGQLGYDVTKELQKLKSHFVEMDTRYDLQKKAGFHNKKE